MAFKKVLASVSLSGPLIPRFQAAAAAGFTGVEIAEGDLAISGLPARELRRPLADLGLSVDLYQPLRDIESVSDEQFQLNLGRIDRALDLMLDLELNGTPDRIERRSNRGERRPRSRRSPAH